MKRIVFDVSYDIYRKIDNAMCRDGFATRAEFLRFLVITYLKQNGFTDGILAGEGRIDSEGARKPRHSDCESNQPKVFEMKNGERYYYGHPEKDFEFGIPQDVIDIMWEEVLKKNENNPQRQS